MVTGYGHRGFLSDFYEGSFPGSFSRGALFQFNPETGDKRISGTFASLAGLERAKEAGDDEGIAHAIERMLLGNALIASFGGVPLIFMGDEIAMTNDYRYLGVSEHAHDSRWLHRPKMDWETALSANETTPEGRVLAGTRHIYQRRKAVPEIHGGHPTRVIASPNQAILAFQRLAPTATLLCLFNFSEEWQNLSVGWLRERGAEHFIDLLSDGPVSIEHGTLTLPPYGRVWLT